MQAGLIRKRDNYPDGDWINSTDVPPGDVPDRAMFTTANVQKILTAVVATKAGLWQMNHHTGQGRMAGYPKKVAGLIWQDGDDVLPEDLRATVMHTLGHWASTRYVLGKAGIEGILPTDKVNPGWKDILALSDDAKLRFQSAPAGTASLEVAFTALQKMLAHPLAPVCPAVANMLDMVRARQQMMRNPVQYHIGAAYFTGRERMQLAVTGDDCLGRLSSFVSAIYGSSTLYQSPKLRCSGSPASLGPQTTRTMTPNGMTCVRRISSS